MAFCGARVYQGASVPIGFAPLTQDRPSAGRPGTPENHRHDVLERATRFELATFSLEG